MELWNTFLSRLQHIPIVQLLFAAVCPQLCSRATFRDPPLVLYEFTNFDCDFLLRRLASDGLPLVSSKVASLLPTVFAAHDPDREIPLPPSFLSDFELPIMLHDHLISID